MSAMVPLALLAAAAAAAGGPGLGGGAPERRRIADPRPLLPPRALTALRGGWCRRRADAVEVMHGLDPPDHACSAQESLDRAGVTVEGGLTDLSLIHI